MSVIINFKSCDNVRECGAPSVCHTKAIFWNDENKSLATDISKCTRCGACESACPAGAILVALTDDEYVEINRQIENDPRTIEELFVDRFGAVAINGTNEVSFPELIGQIDNNIGLHAYEVVNGDNPLCLVSAIPYHQIFRKPIPITKSMVSNSTVDMVLHRLGVAKLPVLLVLKDKKPLVIIEGEVNDSNTEAKMELIERISAAVDI